MRIALLGGGTIARLILEHVKGGSLTGIEVVGLSGRAAGSRGEALARDHGVPFGVGREALLATRPQAVVEAASHDAVREHLVGLLEAGVGVVVLSAGALADDALRKAAEHAARRSGALLYVPSGGIGGLDALKAACVAGVDSVSIRVAKPPAAWKNIPYVDALRLDLDALRGARVLYEGTARQGVPHFPQNVNIAAVLSLAGIGFDRTRLEVVADPALTRNTHTIRVSGKSGNFTVVLENVPSPDNPKTAWLACYSALAALQSLSSGVRYGT
ncbi:MAG TPA: aspartate dehydrogenase [Burkholderiales bacterium]|nr:aspartate dehydrogenase [Burkholderiales bacterium]